MKRTKTLVALAVAATLCGLTIRAATAHDPDRPSGPATIPDMWPYADPTGAIATHSTSGRVDTRGAFFQSLGTNGRTCATCHALDQAMSISTPQIRSTFAKTNGRDPLFASVDGANCPGVKASDRGGHSLLLQHGLLRIGMVLPANPEFTISVVHDPYGCALITDTGTGQTTVSVYRRPLPATNLGFLSAVMFDGRETVVPLTGGLTFAANLLQDLTHQARDAIMGHSQAAIAPTDQQLADIVSFELSLSTAQVWDQDAGMLNGRGAAGGPLNLSKQEYYPGINDVLGADPTGTAFNSSSMASFVAWAKPDSSDDDSDAEEGGFLPWRGNPYRARARARADIAAGERLFNTAPVNIMNVRGLNDSAALNRPTSFQGTCTTCHDTPNVGDHSLPLPVDIGVGHTSRSGFETDPAISKALSELDEPDLPVFLVQGCPNPFNAGQPESFYTTDPGKALVTGQCADLNRLKGPILRGLAARAPYFHNGAARTLLEAVNFYNQRFSMNLTERQKEQLVAFLNSL
jgi:cytochrome c peroxidase